MNLPEVFNSTNTNNTNTTFYEYDENSELYKFIHNYTKEEENYNSNQNNEFVKPSKNKKNKTEFDKTQLEQQVPIEKDAEAFK